LDCASLSQKVIELFKVKVNQAEIGDLVQMLRNLSISIRRFDQYVYYRICNSVEYARIQPRKYCFSRIRQTHLFEINMQNT
jgi:hypothetical protein